MNGTLRRLRPPRSNVAALRNPNISPFYPGDVRFRPRAHASLDWLPSLTAHGCYWLSASTTSLSLAVINNFY